MKFALFYEIPVARPWTAGKEQAAIQDTVEQAVFGEKMGFHSFWTVEHHFLEEFSPQLEPRDRLRRRSPSAPRRMRHRLRRPVGAEALQPSRCARAESAATLDNLFPAAASSSEWGARRLARSSRASA